MADLSICDLTIKIEKGDGVHGGGEKKERMRMREGLDVLNSRGMRYTCAGSCDNLKRARKVPSANFFCLIAWFHVSQKPTTVLHSFAEYMFEKMKKKIAKAAGKATADGSPNCEPEP
jgi:hypothetical protein